SHIDHKTPPRAKIDTGQNKIDQQDRQQARLSRSPEERSSPTDGYTRSSNFTEDRSTPSVSRQFGRSVQEDSCDLAISQNHFATMVRVPGSLGDSGFHCESHEEAHADLSSGKPASLEIGTPTPPLNQDRSADRQSFRRSSTDGTEEGPDESPPAKAIQTLVSKSSTKKKSARSNPLRKKLKAPGSDADDQDDLKTVWTDESLEIAYHKKELHTFLIKNPVMQIIKPKIISDLKGPVEKPTARSSKLEAAKALLHLIQESGITTGSFDANDLYDTRLSAINTTLMPIFDLLKPLVGEKSVTAKITTRSTDDMLRSLPAITLKDQTGTSLHYESATEEVDTDSADDPPRMTLGPSDQATVTDVITPNITQGSNAKLESYFQAAINRFLKEQQGPSNPVILAPAEDRDVDMESPDQHPNLHEYDPDDLDLDPPRRAAVASASATTTGRSTSVPRIRVSAMSELKEFAGNGRTDDGIAPCPSDDKQ
ncbi:LOW QUALITY PROTEIN: Hypothetical protein PHPALM_1655, partial [Phytophthora palmivora]